jgi:HEAT repeat protein
MRRSQSIAGPIQRPRKEFGGETHGQYEKKFEKTGTFCGENPLPKVSFVTFLVGLLLVGVGDVAGQFRDLPVDALIEKLTVEDVDQRRDAAYEIVRRGEVSAQLVVALAESVKDRDPQVRFQSLMALARAGQTAEPAIASLIDCLDDRDDQIRFRAADALGAIGPAAIEPLIARWDQASERSKIAIAQALQRIGPPASDGGPLLLAAIDGDSVELARNAAGAFASITPLDEQAWLRLAGHQDAVVRGIGLSSLAGLDHPSTAAIDAIIAACDDSDATIREAAIVNLARSQVSDVEKARRIEAALVDPVVGVRAAALVAMQTAEMADTDFSLNLARRLKDAPPELANSLLRTLGQIGEPAAVSLPMVLEIADRKDVDSHQVSRTLSSFGSPVVPQLLRAIEQQPEIEPILSEALALIGQPAIPSLVTGLDNPTELVRMASVRALGAVRPIEQERLKQIADALDDASADVRSVAVAALVAVGEDANFASEMLLAACEDRDPRVRAAAIGVLKVQDYPAEVVDQTIAKGLADDAAVVRTESLHTAKEISGKIFALVENVIELTTDDDPAVRSAAIHALGEVSEKQLEETKSGTSVGETIAKAVEQALGDPTLEVRVAATELAGQLGLGQSAIQRGLAANMDSDLPLLRASLATVTRLGQKASGLVTDVEPLLRHPEADIRGLAVTALAAIEQDPARLTSLLIGVLDDSEWAVRRTAGSALGQLGPAAKEAVPSLFKLLASEEDSDFASGALKEINSAPESAIPLLIENLGSEDRRAGYYAVTLLGKIGPPASEALPKLQAMLDDRGSGGRGSDFRRTFLREAIASIKGEAPSENER